MTAVNKQKKPDKIGELFYRASLKAMFHTDVLKIRAMFGIPRDGFKNAEIAEKWFLDYINNKRPDPSGTNFFVEERNFLTRHGLPLGAPTLFRSYILLDGKQHIDLNFSDDVCEIDSNINTPVEIESSVSIRIVSPTETKWHASGQAFVKLFISANATPTDIQRYIKNNWSKIKVALKEQSGKKLVRVRAMTNKDRDKKILELYGLSRQELGLKKGEPGQYKDIAIASRMKELGYKVTPENVRKIGSRQRKLHNP